MFNPKIVIVNYYDALIHQVDIDIEETLKQYNENQVLSELKCFEFEKKISEATIEMVLSGLKCFQFKKQRKIELNIRSFLSLFESSENAESEYQTVELWSESTKVVDYLNQIRMRTIDELRKAQEETLEYYKLNSTRIKSLEEISDVNKIEELKSQLFAERFYFQVRIKGENKPWVFNLFTFVTDFYMSPSDIHILEMFINSDYLEISNFCFKSNHLFDEKMVLICLLTEYFRDNLINQKYPNHVILVRKRDIENIKMINFPFSVREFKLTCSSMDFSKLKILSLPKIADSNEFELDGLSSLEYLKVSSKSVERIALRNLPSLKHLVWRSNNQNLNFDDFINLEILQISGEIDEDFNFGLFKNICNHLKELYISLSNISNEQITELFYGLNFPNLVKLSIDKSQITQLKKKMFEGFPMLQSLTINENSELRRIESDAFSSLTNLVELNLHHNSIDSINQKHFSRLVKLNSISLYNNRIEFIEENCFSNLTNLTKLNLGFNCLQELNPHSLIGLENLKILNLSKNRLKKFDLSILEYIGNIEEIDLILNSISNKDEIEERFKDSKIRFIIRNLIPISRFTEF